MAKELTHQKGEASPCVQADCSYKKSLTKAYLLQLLLSTDGDSANCRGCSCGIQTQERWKELRPRCLR